MCATECYFYSLLHRRNVCGHSDPTKGLPALLVSWSSAYACKIFSLRSLSGANRSVCRSGLEERCKPCLTGEKRLSKPPSPGCEHSPPQKKNFLVGMGQGQFVNFKGSTWKHYKVGCKAALLVFTYFWVGFFFKLSSGQVGLLEM